MSVPPPRRFRADETPAQGEPVGQARPVIPPPRRFEMAPVDPASPSAAALARPRAQERLTAFRPASATASPTRSVPRPVSSAGADPAEAPAVVRRPASGPVPIGPVSQAPARPSRDLSPTFAEADGPPVLEPPPPSLTFEPSPGRPDLAAAPPSAGAEQPTPTSAGPSGPADGEAAMSNSEVEEAPTLADLLTLEDETLAQISGDSPSRGLAGMRGSAAGPAGMSRTSHLLGTPYGANRAAEPVDAGLRTAQAESAPAVAGQPGAALAAETKADPGREETQDSGSEWLLTKNFAPTAAPSQDIQVERTGCATCGGFHSSLDGPLLHGCLTCGGGPSCVPGRKPCNSPYLDCETTIGAFCQRLYECLCCPDPCYQPAWVPAANASFFADYARPRTVTRLRYDNLEAMTRPDRNQFFLNSVTVPSGRRGRVPGNLLFARLQQLYLYQEAAGERGSFFVEIPYRQVNMSWEPTQAGFGDINFGIKSLLFDCEMLQISFQFRTYMPSGNYVNNLGTGQFALDPSILTSLKLTPSTYFQGQFGNWIPLGGPGNVNLSSGDKMAGGVFYWLMSVNQVLWYATPDSPLIATLEMDGWSFENGGYTSAIRSGGTPHRVPDGGGVSYFNIGPGLRQSVCNRLDFGGAITWATDTAHWAQPWLRLEARFLF